MSDARTSQPNNSENQQGASTGKSRYKSEPTPNSKTRKILRITLLSLLALILLTELALRIFRHDVLRQQQYPLIYTPNDSLGYTYRPNTQARISIPGINKNFRINKNGYLGPDFDTLKPPGTFRIAIAGSSQGTGIWMQTEENFAMKLQAKLAQAGYKTEVLNFSIDGRYRDLQTFRLARMESQRYKPDLLLIRTSMPFIESRVYRDIYKGYVMIYGHRPGSRKSCEEIIDYIEQYGFLISLYELSYIVRQVTRTYRYSKETPITKALEVFMRKRVEAKDILYIPKSSNYSANQLRALERQLQSHGGEMLVFDYWEDDFYERIARKYCLPYYAMKIELEKKLYNTQDGHFNDTGHELVAAMLFKTILKRQLIPAEYRKVKSDLLN